MRKYFSAFTICFTVFIVFKCPAQSGWQWVRKNSFSNYTTVPFQDSWLEALGPGGTFYTVTTTGGQSSSNILAGTVTHCGLVDVVDSTDCAQMLVARIDSAGNYLWASGTQHANVSSAAITTDQAGNVYVLAVYDSATVSFGGIKLSHPFGPPSEKMYFIVKYNAAGNALWAANVGLTYAGGIGDVSFPPGTISVDGTGNVYVSGVFFAPSITIGSVTLTDTSFSDPALFFAKFDATGNPVWAKGFGNVSYNSTDLSAVATTDGDVFLAGLYTNSSITFGPFTLSSTTGSGIFLTRFDSAGHTKWAKGIECNGSDLLGGLTADRNMNIYITGGFLNSTIAFGSHILTNTFPGNSDVYLAKFDSSGNTVWAKSAGGHLSDQGFSVAVDTKGQVWLTGNISNGFYSAGYTFDFGSDTTITAIAGTFGDDPLFIAEYDTAGNFKQVFTITGGGDDQCDIIVDNMGNFYLCGDWNRSTQNFGSDTLLPDSLEEQAFVARYRYDTAFPMMEVPLLLGLVSQGISLFPNPTTTLLTIQSISQPIHQITITNLLGQKVYTNSYNSDKVEINVAGLPSGIYFVKINNTEVRKFVKE